MINSENILRLYPIDTGKEEFRLVEYELINSTCNVIALCYTDSIMIGIMIL
jgi:hypothetical protein